MTTACASTARAPIQALSPLPCCNDRVAVRAQDDRLVRALRENQAALARTARTLCGNRADADDLLHDVYERALRAQRRDDHANLRAWLHSILRNLFIDRCRYARRHPTPMSLDEIDVAEAQPELAAAWTTVSEAQLHAALAHLPSDFRRVFELHTFEGLRYDEIASRLAIAPSTVGTRLSRARAKLRVILQRALDEDCAPAQAAA